MINVSTGALAVRRGNIRAVTFKNFAEFSEIQTGDSSRWRQVKACLFYSQLICHDLFWYLRDYFLSELVTRWSVFQQLESPLELLTTAVRQADRNHVMLTRKRTQCLSEPACGRVFCQSKSDVRVSVWNMSKSAENCPCGNFNRSRRLAWCENLKR